MLTFFSLSLIQTNTQTYILLSHYLFAKSCTIYTRKNTVVFKLRSNFLSKYKPLGTIIKFILFNKCSHFNPSYSFLSSVTVDFRKLLIFLLLPKIAVSLLSALCAIFRVKLPHRGVLLPFFFSKRPIYPKPFKILDFIFRVAPNPSNYRTFSDF